MEKVFSALAEPNRLQIIELLRQSPLTVGEISDHLGLRQPQTSKHLRVLRDAGLVDIQPVANRRIYKLRSESFKDLDNWLQSYCHIWDERFDRLDNYLVDLQRKDTNINDDGK
ncbi:metalloregulator ArsR/SmtB family transcription factor [Mangrovibacillus sp. Mu-81]|jgi:DNA-binding transcriptional ArsR family regulator|uniref:ArsR/SmtB family transcription factor n=1 Tax=Mangrovibacillus sp. Mu-81 TaxID=3121478 RepID=UPI002FE45741